jgi:Nuclease-related domain
MSMALRMLVLRRAEACVVCGFELPAGATAWWDARAKAVTCATCQEGAAGPTPGPPAAVDLDRGRAGASVAREHQRRKAIRETRVREAHPRIGGVLLAVGHAPQRETAFRQGELGELAVGAFLEKRTANGPTVALHDRRMPGERGNIDHLAVAPCGVLVVDAKQYSGKVRVVDRGFRGERLAIAERDLTKLIDGLDRQVSIVRNTLDAHGHADVPVHGVLCFRRQTFRDSRHCRSAGISC